MKPGSDLVPENDPPRGRRNEIRQGSSGNKRAHPPSPVPLSGHASRRWPGEDRLPLRRPGYYTCERQASAPSPAPGERRRAGGRIGESATSDGAGDRYRAHRGCSTTRDACPPAPGRSSPQRLGRSAMRSPPPAVLGFQDILRIAASSCPLPGRTRCWDEKGKRPSRFATRGRDKNKKTRAASAVWSVYWSPALKIWSLRMTIITKTLHFFRC